MVTQALDGNNNKIEQVDTALPFKRTQPHQAGKKLGADTLIIMQQLGYSDEQITALTKSRCI